MKDRKAGVSVVARVQRLQSLLDAPSSKALAIAMARVATAAQPPPDKREALSRSVATAAHSRAIAQDPSPKRTISGISRTSRTGSPPIPSVSLQPPPRVSVVMTTFNAAKTVEAAIWSLLNQSQPVSEIIVADDLSSDDTRDVVTRMAAREPRIRLICMSQNRGTYWAKNTALTVATGDVVTFMDSDDISMPKRIEVQLKGLARQGTAATLCGCVRVDESGAVVLNRGLATRSAPISLMFHRSILQDVGYFDTVRTSADSEFSARLKATFGSRSIHEIAEPLYVARIRKDSLSSDPLNPVSLGQGAGSFLSPARQAYQDGFVAWHAAEVAAGQRPYVCFPVSERPFPVHERLLVSESANDPTTISAFMATYPPRLEQLQQVVPTLIGQVDRLYVYLNGYTSIPAILKHERIFPVLGGNRNLRDAGKFFSVSGAPKGYWFFVDDDILYPEDYCDVLVRAIERYRRKAVVGVHGIVLSRPLDRYFSDKREVYPFQASAEERPVNIIGTGTAASHSSTIDIDKEALSSVGMADIFLGIRAKRAGVPMVIVQRPDLWLKPTRLPPGHATLYQEFIDRDEAQTRLLRAEGDWVLDADRLMDGCRVLSS